MNKNYRLAAFYLVALITCGAIFGCLIVGFAAIPNNTIRQNAGAVMPTFNATGAGYFVGPDMIVSAARAASFVTLDTGQGANELYDMDQNMLTSSDVQFSSVDARAFLLNSVDKTDLFAYPQTEASYIIWSDGGTPPTYYAKNGQTGQIEFSGAVFSTVMQNGVDSLIGSGGRIYICEGNYPITVPIIITADGLTIEGVYSEGPHGTYLQALNGVTGFLIQGIDGDNVWFTTLKNFKLRGSYPTHGTGYGIYFNQYTSDIRLENLYVAYCGETGIYVGNGWGANMYGCIVENHHGNGLTVVGGGFRIIGNKFLSNDLIGVRLGTGQGAETDAIFEGNQVGTNGQEGLYAQHKRLKIVGNAFVANGQASANTYYNCQTRGESCVVTGNSFYDDGTDVKGNLYGAGLGLVVSGNTFYGGKTYSITVVGNYEAITGNTVTACAGDGIYVWGTYGDNEITGNTCFSNTGYDVKIAAGTCNRNRVENNQLLSVLKISDSGTNTVIGRNGGYVTENIGTATILNGTTSIVINHGLGYTPTSGNTAWTVSYLENPTNDPGSWYIDTFTATQATIHVFRDPGISHLDIAWSARRTP